MFRLFLILFIASQSAICCISGQTCIYVSQGGNDANTGSISKPFKSLEHALKMANRYQGEQVTVYLRKGIYYLDSTLVIDAERFTPRSLTLCNYNNESVSISAGKLLKLKWSIYKNGIYRTKIPVGIQFEQLFVNGAKQILARYPNYDASSRILRGTSKDAISKTRVRTWQDPAGGYLHGLQAYQWGSLHYRIVGKNDDGTLKLMGGWQNNRPSTLHKAYRYVENVFEELDTIGEWFLDKKNRVLYYYPPDRFDLKSASIVVSQFKNSIVLKGSSRMRLRNVHIKGITFTHNERSFMATREPLLRSDWRIYRGGALLLKGTDSCSIQDCTFHDLGGNAVMVSGYNKKSVIRGCYFYQLGANAICFIGSEKSVRSPINNYEGHIAYDKLDKQPGPLTDDYPQECVADNNLIRDIGLTEKQVAAVDINIASDIQVSHNTIYNVPRAGINIGDGCFGGHIIEYNNVFNTVLETGDHGAFNSWGRDRFWNADRDYMDSLIAVHPELILLDVQKKIVLRNNCFSCNHGWAIDLDDGSSNYEIFNNLCLSGGIKFREGFYRRGYNNIIINNTFHPHVWFKNSHDIFEHNIVLEPYKPIGLNGWGDTVDYNLFLTKEDLQRAQAEGVDLHSNFGNAEFINPGKGNYQVSSHSPALEIGFKNFPMDQFGVQKPALKKIAARPVFPECMLHKQGFSDSRVTTFHGAGLKSVNGLGDRSAYGLADENGVVILSLGHHTLFADQGFRVNDVILKCADIAVKTADQFIKLMQPLLKAQKTITIELIRNQQPVVLKIKP